MKTTRFTGIILALVIFSLASHQALAQTKEEIRDIDEAAMEQEMKVKKEMLKVQHLEMSEQVRQLAEFNRAYAAEARSSGRSSYVFSSGDSPYILQSMDHGNQSQLTLRNSFSGGSDLSKGEFDVSNGTRMFRCMINGKVRSGKITIKVMYPGGKVFKELTITSSAEIMFSQSLKINEESDGKYFGSWKYEVSAEKAEGNYMLQISTN